MYQVMECGIQTAISRMIPGSLCRPPASCSNSADLGRPSGQSRCCNSPQPPDGPLFQGLPPTSEMLLVVGWGLAPGHSPQPQSLAGILKWLFPYDPVCACRVFRHQRRRQLGRGHRGAPSRLPAGLPCPRPGLSLLKLPGSSSSCLSAREARGKDPTTHPQAKKANRTREPLQHTPEPSGPPSEPSQGAQCPQAVLSWTPKAGTADHTHSLKCSMAASHLFSHSREKSSRKTPPAPTQGCRRFRL